MRSKSLKWFDETFKSFINNQGRWEHDNPNLHDEIQQKMKDLGIKGKRVRNAIDGLENVRKQMFDKKNYS